MEKSLNPPNPVTSAVFRKVGVISLLFQTKTTYPPYQIKIAEKVACLKPEITDWTQVVRVICNSPHCNQSGETVVSFLLNDSNCWYLPGFMHSECFEKFEELIAHYMSKQGRGRTWNEKQVNQ